MANKQIFVKHGDTNKNWELKKFAADIKKSKDYTDLEAACTIT